MQFLKNANLPEKKVGYVCVDERIGKALKDNISALGIKMIFAPAAKGLSSPIRSHADVVLHHLGGRDFVCEPTVYEYFKGVFKNEDINLICGKAVLKNSYPDDCFYNAARVGDTVFTGAADSSILDFDTRKYTRKINVKQGYAKCSICIAAKRAIITADAGIFKAAEKNGFDVLKIQSGFIGIEGYDYGFIGGASGLLAKDIMGFCGDVKTHPDGENILSFLRNYNIYAENLGSGMLFDIGSILPIAYE